MDKFIGKRLDGRYHIQAVIGSGGMAVVYKAVDVQENRLVAVKVLRDECMQNEDLVRRFKNESKAISVLNHPNIVKVYDVSVSENLQYIVMEFIDGITLKDYMKFRKQPLSYKETLHFVTQTLLAMQHAHSKGIVHRDIKPQNIMLLSNGNIKVMDFGIARFARSENQTMTDKAIGSVHYISPEQAKGDVTDLKADIYSVGVMMYEMLAGRLPFDGESPVGVAIKQISDTATPLHEINPTVPLGLEQITQRAMAKEARERYASANAMLADIEAFKRDPNIQFEYQYLTDTSQTKYIEKAVSNTASRQPSNQRAQSSQNKRSTSKRGSRNSIFKKKWLLPAMAGGTLAFFLIAAFACYSLLKDTLLFSTAEDVELPNFVDKMRSEVEGNAEYANFPNIVFEEVNDPDKPAGTIVSQTPKPPKTIKNTAKIILRVSRGVVQVPVPDIVGADQASAMQTMKDAGIQVMLKREMVQSASDPYGYVLRLTTTDGASLQAGQLVDTGSTVVMYVSAEYRNDEVQVPQCVGLVSVEEASTLLGQRMLMIGTITEEDSTAPAGSIIRQSPEYIEPTGADDKRGYVKQGTLVNLVISKGHEHTYVETGRVEPEGCETPGVITYVCEVCGDSYTEQIPAHGHSWGEWVVIEEATETKEGLRRRVCTRDSNHVQEEKIPMKENSGGSGNTDGNSGNNH